MTTQAERIALPGGGGTTLERWGVRGPAILLVHGIGSSRRDATRLGEALAATHRVFAYDQRGHGDSTGAAEIAGSFALDALANDLGAVADHIGDELCLIGHSWGGAVAVLGAPRCARTLIVVDPLLRVPAGGFHEYVDDLRDVLGVTPGPQREAAIREAFSSAHSLDREAKVHAMRTMELATIVKLGSNNAANEGGWDVRAALRAVPVPTQVLLAGDESVVGGADLDEISPATRIRVFTGHGHTLHRTAFDEFAGIVRSTA